MREIIFRGKSGTEWVYGDLWRLHEGRVAIRRNDKVLPYEVIPETVGQYTGLMDKNGSMIFEGDVVELTDVNNDIKWNAIVVFGNPCGEYCWGWNLMYVGANPKVNTDILCWVDMEETGATIEVIGNIYDKLSKGVCKE